MNKKKKYYYSESWGKILGECMKQHQALYSEILITCGKKMMISSLEKFGDMCRQISVSE